MKILQRISHVFKFATPKAAKVKEDPTPIVKPRTLIINDNLRFDAKKFVMFMLPYYSKILTNGPTYLEMDTTSSVLELSFVDKAKNDVHAVLFRWSNHLHGAKEKLSNSLLNSSICFWT